MAKKSSKTDVEEPQVQQEPQIEQAQVVEDISGGNADYNPLGEAVKERSYTKPKIDGANLEAEIEEPTFTPPSFADMEEPAGFEAAQEQQFANPALNDLSDKDKKYATEQMVDVVLDGYEKLTGLANNLVQIKDSRLQGMINRGELNPRVRIPIDASGGSLSVQEFVTEFNEQTSEAISTSDEFKTEVRPAMVRVFEKRGIGMTDEQFLMYKFGSDMVMKGAVVVQLRSQINSMLDLMKDLSNQQAATATPPPPSPTQASAPTPEPTPTPEPEPVEFVEPEEEVVGFQDEGPTFDGAPEFGDPAILAELSRLSEEDNVKEEAPKPKRKRGRPRKNS
jgi:hypothetical protein